MIYRLEDISQEIIVDLDLDIAAASVAFWIRNNIGTLNNLIYTTYSINDNDSQISPSIGIEEIAILKKIYEVYNYDRIIRTNMGASAFSSVIEISDNGNSVKLANKNEIAKTFSDLRRQSSEELNRLVNSYLVNKAGDGGTLSVDGIDGDFLDPNLYIENGYTRLVS